MRLDWRYWSGLPTLTLHPFLSYLATAHSSPIIWGRLISFPLLGFEIGSTFDWIISGLFLFPGNFGMLVWLVENKTSDFISLWLSGWVSSWVFKIGGIPEKDYKTKAKGFTYWGSLFGPLVMGKGREFKFQACKWNLSGRIWFG